jgi:hypothetical protein
LNCPHRRRCRPAAGGRPLVAGRPWATDRQATTAGRPTSGDQRSGPGRCRATGLRPLVAGSPATRGRRPKVGGPGPAGDQRSYAGRGSTPAPVGAVPIFLEMFFLLALHFLCKWSTLAGWLQHMPTLPRLLLETSNIHDFLSVGPKNTIFFPAKFSARRMFIKSFKKSKNSVCSSDTNQNRFVRHTDI